MPPLLNWRRRGRGRGGGRGACARRDGGSLGHARARRPPGRPAPPATTPARRRPGLPPRGRARSGIRIPTTATSRRGPPPARPARRGRQGSSAHGRRVSLKPGPPARPRHQPHRVARHQARPPHEGARPFQHVHPAVVGAVGPRLQHERRGGARGRGRRGWRGLGGAAARARARARASVLAAAPPPPPPHSQRARSLQGVRPVARHERQARLHGRPGQDDAPARQVGAGEGLGDEHRAGRHAAAQGGPAADGGRGCGGCGGGGGVGGGGGRGWRRRGGSSRAPGAAAGRGTGRGGDSRRGGGGLRRRRGQGYGGCAGGLGLGGRPGMCGVGNEEWDGESARAEGWERSAGGQRARARARERRGRFLRSMPFFAFFFLSSGSPPTGSRPLSACRSCRPVLEGACKTARCRPGSGE